MASNSLVRVKSKVGYVRRVWSVYQGTPLWVRVFTPILSFSLASGALQWSWSVLAQGEYGAAMLLTLAFVLVAIGASLLIPVRIVKVFVMLIVIALGGYSAAVIVKAKGNKSWTTLWSQPNAPQTQELPQPVQTQQESNATSKASRPAVYELFRPAAQKYKEELGDAILPYQEASAANPWFYEALHEKAWVIFGRSGSLGFYKLPLDDSKQWKFEKDNP